MKRNKTIKRVGAILVSMVVAMQVFTGCASKPGSESTVMREITTMELVKEMGMGTNLGNTFEAAGNWIDSSSVTNYETGWGSPVVTEEMIKGYATEGFGVLRVPVAWSNMMGEDYTINADYLARVREVIDWALDAELYVIMNIHWDGGWWEAFPTDKENCMAKYTRIWEQLSEEFKDYSDYLMFESLNEEGGWEKVWNRYSGSTDGKDESYGLLNEINQKFVDIVRSSGGNNAKRHLLIAGYTTDIELTTDPLFKMPNDTENRCAVSVHYYTPPTFCILDKDADWGKARTEWGNEEDIAQLDGNMKLMKETFVDKGVPVIIGEYGVSTKNKTEETVRNFIVTVADYAFKYELCPVLWDVTDVFYDRTEYKMIDSQLMDGLLKAAGEKE